MTFAYPPRYANAIRRHLLLWQAGEVRADDSEVSHLGHIAASCAILLDAALADNLEAKIPLHALAALKDALERLPEVWPEGRFPVE